MLSPFVWVFDEQKRLFPKFDENMFILQSKGWLNVYSTCISIILRKLYTYILFIGFVVYRFYA